MSAGLYSSDDPLALISGVTYTYNNPVAQLKKITRSDGQAYNFTYDIWGRVTDIKVGNRLLSHSVYTKASNDTQLAYTEYGNGAKIYYTYDWLDRIIAQSTTDPENGGTPYVSYDYNSEGLVGRVTDNLANVKTEYHYDLLGRLVSSNMSSGYIDRYAYSYSNSNELTKASAFLRDGTLAVASEYEYDDSGRLIQSELGEYTVHYTYDVLDRVTCEKAVHEDGTEYYTYYSYLTVGDNTTSFVDTITYWVNYNGQTEQVSVGSVHYTYDRNGFISSVTTYDSMDDPISTESYTYDALGQLKTVTNGNNVTEYTYDTAGNILSKKVNGTVVGSYTYGDSQWKDLLTSYNGQTITYDGIGNPTTYIGWSNLTWSMGRRLTALSNSTDSITYNYNANGQRISKTVNGVTTEFYYDDRGALILSSCSDGTNLYFYPDADGSIGSFSYNNEQYYYVRNAQNDVIGITDKNGNFVAKYTYDEWGKILSITDGNGVDVSNNPSHIANLNPFRYRSYFYDAETGFYWLNTRYYDPEIGRFINADGYLSTGQGVIGHNMYAYCNNNFVCMYDDTGCKPGDLFDSPDEAARDFGLCYNDMSISDKQEYGSAIYRVPVVTVTYPKTPWYLLIFGIRLAPVYTVTFKYSYTTPSIGKTGDSVLPNLLTVRTIVSTVHTHANYDPKYRNEDFSTGTFSDIWWSDFFKMNSYIVTPGGFLKKYTYKNRNDSNDGVTIIANDMPWDPNSPDH